jgi:FlaG protein
MDVQAAAAIALAPIPVTRTAPDPGSPASAAAAPAVAAPAGAVSAPAQSDSGSQAGTNGSGSGNPAIGDTPGLATLPAGPPDGAKKAASGDEPLANGVAQLFNAKEQNVSVSFHVESNEIVTVFTDKQTGKVIVQFPSETLIALAKFFDKLDGSVVNKKV